MWNWDTVTDLVICEYTVPVYCSVCVCMSKIILSFSLCLCFICICVHSCMCTLTLHPCLRVRVRLHCSCINDVEKYPCCSSDNSTNIVSCVCEVSSRASCMTDGGPIDCSQSSGLPAKIGPLAKSSLAQLICHRAGQSRLHKLHRPTKLTRCVLKPVLPSPTVH